MRQLAFLAIALGLLLGALAPVLETIDRWDAYPELTSDTEFQLAAVAIGAGLAIIALLAPDQILQSLLSHSLFEPVIGLRWSGLHPGEALPSDFRPCIRPPLRI